MLLLLLRLLRLLLLLLVFVGIRHSRAGQQIVERVVL